MATDETQSFLSHPALLGGLLCSIIATQTSFIDHRSNVRAFDFERRTRLALPEQSLSMLFLKKDLRRPIRRPRISSATHL
jgi:hypothetical protein